MYNVHLMRLTFLHIIKRSLLYDLKSVVYLLLITVLLTSVVTGSLMTGKSVRRSLKQTSAEKLGNTGIVISSGLRFTNPSLPARLTSRTGVATVGLTEIEGFCQSFSTGRSTKAVKIFAIDEQFFSFHGNETVKVNAGEVAVNESLADYLDIQNGDEIILRFNPITDIPSDAPFTPGKNSSESLVMKVGKILDKNETANFSLNITQIIPFNIFINRSDLRDSEGNIPDINRILFRNQKEVNVKDIYNNLKDELKPEDIGLKIRFVPSAGMYEAVSDRIFIDQVLYEEILGTSLKSFPVITYLANSIEHGRRSTPYSFISAIDPGLDSSVPAGNRILINNWLAEDLGAKENDTLSLAWYSPDPLKRLVEVRSDFIVSELKEMKGIFGDSLLMPEFPGIAGSKSCTDWDAGVEIKLDLIRKKDEEYWNKFRGTPKAFISYTRGNELWSSNFGPVTAIRFSPDLSEKEIIKTLAGAFDPDKSGFSISDLPRDSANAADEGVDFSTLFLSLGFFIILSALILLILLVSSYFESKKNHLKTLFSIGFPDRKIEKLLLLEAGIVGISGTFIGTLTGALFNVLLIKALNTVWKGAVQTSSLVPGLDGAAMITGFVITVIVIFLVLKIKITGFLRKLNQPVTGETRKPSVKKNVNILIISAALTIISFILTFIFETYRTPLFFMTGLLLFSFMIIVLRLNYVFDFHKTETGFRKLEKISRSFYSFHPSHAITPVIFIAAGLFAVIITGVNRMNITGNMLKPSGGTGGFLLWGETSLPVLKDLNSQPGRNEYGLNSEDLKEMSIIQAKRTSGNDASCLNLNHVTSPPVIGIDPEEFVKRGSFSFASTIKNFRKENPWKAIDNEPSNHTIYGIADQTVLQYGLKIKTGDTLKIRSESGQILNIVISSGLKSSVFQGFVIIGKNNFTRYFPSVSGNQVFLVSGNRESIGIYEETLNERLSEFGADFRPASERLASFFIVTNTYLSVFTILGGIGMILGVVGLGFVVTRNFHQRKSDFGLLLATGFSLVRIRQLVFKENATILIAGIITGIIPAIVATFPTVKTNEAIPWVTMATMILLILITGFTALWVSVRNINRESLIATIRKE